jgi:hypothetical protein
LLIPLHQRLNRIVGLRCGQSFVPESDYQQKTKTAISVHNGSRPGDQWVPEGGVADDLFPAAKTKS